MSDWLTAGAIFLSFLCTQSAFDMADQQRSSSVGYISAARYQKLYITKEVFWVASCLALGNVPLIASTVIFALYPVWRRHMRTRKSPESLQALQRAAA